MNASKVSFLALAATLNVVGSFIAFTFKLPIYLDNIGTIFAAAMLGPFYGIMPGLVSSLISGFMYDAYAFYYMPSQMLTGIITGLIYRRTQPKGVFLFPTAAIISLPGTVISAVTTASVFGGVTSAGSSILVQLLSHMGINLTLSVCIVQALTDFADRAVCLFFVTTVMAAIPVSVKRGGFYE